MGPDPTCDPDHGYGEESWRRAPGDYVRPKRRVMLQRGSVRHNLSGTNFYCRALDHLRWGSEVAVELVPEPQNPFDSTAVCVELDGTRLGYLGRGFAEFWHPIVRGFNAAGSYVRTSAVIIREDYCDNSIDVFLPDWSEWDSVARQSGLMTAFDSLWAQLSPAAQSDLINGYGRQPRWRTVREISEHRHLLPAIPPERFDEDQLPFTVLHYVRQRAIEEYERREGWTTDQSAQYRDHDVRLSGPRIEVCLDDDLTLDQTAIAVAVPKSDCMKLLGEYQALMTR
ncbi:hypothetical protein KAREA_03150 [Prescottella equi]|nr:hypothetical protein KAREA_03150 [Prescottella equi]SUE03405.1 Uncharacterised protein [Prescottella equi]SUE21524.1 Uncharacterised protein [Prescottella equi]